MFNLPFNTLRDALLEVSSIYQLQQWAIGASACHREFVNNQVRPMPAMHLLDLGCGPGTTASHLPDGIFYVGIDISEQYVKRAKKKLQNQRNFLPGSKILCADVADVDWCKFEPFDIAVAFGLLHHLSDETASSMLSSVSGLLAPNGRIVCIDPVFLEPQNSVDRWLVSIDRGRFVRSPEDMQQLFPDGRTEIKVYRDLLRITYSQLVTSWSRV